MVTFSSGELQRVVVSVRGGLVNCVYGDDSKVQVLIVDHDNRYDEDALPEDKAANSEWLVPLLELEGDTLEAVKQFDIMETSGNEVSTN